MQVRYWQAFLDEEQRASISGCSSSIKRSFVRPGAHHRCVTLRAAHDCAASRTGHVISAQDDFTLGDNESNPKALTLWRHLYLSRNRQQTEATWGSSLHCSVAVIELKSSGLSHEARPRRLFRSFCALSCCMERET
jgi:hypothetical protein